MSSVLDTLDEAEGGLTRSVKLVLNAKLAAQWESLLNELEAASRKDSDSGSLALPETTRIINQMDAIRDQVEASEVSFVFDRMDWIERVELQAAHPPRKDHLVDATRGYNVATFIPAIIEATCIKVVGVGEDNESDEIPASTWQRLLVGQPKANPPVKPVLNHGQIRKLADAAIGANEGETQVPPSARFLLETQDSGASLAQPDPGQAPPPSGGKGGSRRGSPKSSATKKGKSSSS